MDTNRIDQLMKTLKSIDEGRFDALPLGIVMQLLKDKLIESCWVRLPTGEEALRFRLTPTGRMTLI